MGFPGWKQGDVQVNRRGDLVVEATPPSIRPEHCKGCQLTQGKGFYNWGSRTREVHDMPYHGQRKVLLVTQTRWKCRECGTTRWDWPEQLVEDRKITARVYFYLAEQCWDRKFVDVAREVGCDEEIVRRMFLDEIRSMEQFFNPAAPRILGIDEVHLLKHPRGTLVCHDSRALIDILKDFNQATFAERFKRMPEKTRTEVVTMDQTPKYRNLIHRYFRNAVVIADKWHVLAHADRCFATIFSRQREELERRDRVRIWGHRYLFRKHWHALNDDEKGVVEDWFIKAPTIAAAYHVKEGFYRIYRSLDREEAEYVFNEWLASITPDVQLFRETVANTVLAWKEEYLNYFEYGRHTNALTEALNLKIKEAQRGGRGYSFEVLRGKMLYRMPPRVTRVDRHDDTQLWAKVVGARRSSGPPPTRSAAWHRRQEQYEPRDAGADLSTLLEMLTPGSL